jgi:hypothetical protein
MHTSFSLNLAPNEHLRCDRLEAESMCIFDFFYLVVPDSYIFPSLHKCETFWLMQMLICMERAPVLQLAGLLRLFSPSQWRMARSSADRNDAGELL